MSEARAKDEARTRVDRGLRVLLPIAVLALGVVVWELVVRVGDTALRAAEPAPRLFHPDLRPGGAVGFPPRHAHDHARGFSARGRRRRRARRAVQPVPPDRILALSLRGDPAGY